MGFARYLNNKQVDLSGIQQYNPDLELVDNTLNSIQTNYDTTMALANTLPEHLDGDSPRMLALQEKYNLEMDEVKNLYSLDASSGNAKLKELQGVIQRDFGPTGEAYRAGKRYEDVNKFKENVFASGMPLDYAQSFLDKHSSKSAFDTDGNYVPWEAPASMPTIPNFSEIMLNAGNEILPDTNSIDSVEKDVHGNWVAIITKSGVRRTKEEIKNALTSLAGGVPDITGAIAEFGDPAQKGLNDAIEGVMAAKYQNDSTLKITPVSGGKGSSESKIPKVPTSDGTAHILEVGQVLVEDEKLKYQEEHKTDAKGNIIEDEYLDKTKTADAVEIKENLDMAAISTANVKGDLIDSASGNLAESIINHKYISKTDFSDSTAAIDIKPSEYYMRDVYVEDPLNLGINTPITRYDQGIQNYTIATAMQDASKGKDNFLLATKAELASVKNTDQLLELFKSKTEGIPQGEVQKLLDSYDEAVIAKKFNRSLDKADKVVNNRNRILNRKEVIDQEVDKAWRGDLIEEDIRLLDGDNLTNDEWSQVAKHYGKEDVTTNLFGNADTRGGLQLKLEKVDADIEKAQAKVASFIQRREERGEQNDPEGMLFTQARESLEDLINKKTSLEATLEDENLPTTSKKFEKFKEKHLEFLEGYDKSEYIADAVRNNYKSVQIRNVFTNLNTVNGVPNLQGSPGSNSKLSTIQKVEHSFAAQLGAIESGSGKDATYRPSSGFDLGSIINISSGKRLSEETTENANIVGVEYLGLSRDAEGTYEMIGRTQIVDEDGNITTGDRVRVQNPSFDKQYRQLLYSGKPLVIKQATDPLWDELIITNDNFVEDKAILGDGYSLRLVKDNDGSTDAVIWDSIGNKMLTDGKLENLEDSYDLADRLGGILRGNIAKSYDKDLDWNSLQSYEDGFQADNIKFAKHSTGQEMVERRAVTPAFGDKFNEVFGAYQSDVNISSMLRSLDNQKELEKNADSNNAGPQYTSGHLVGLGIDVLPTPQLLQEMAEDGFNIKKAKEGYVNFKGMKIWYHDMGTGMHLDIKMK